MRAPEPLSGDLVVVLFGDFGEAFRRAIGLFTYRWCSIGGQSNAMLIEIVLLANTSPLRALLCQAL